MHSVQATASAGNVAQFSGSYLSKLWARRFVMGTVLQRYSLFLPQAGSPSDVLDTTVDQALISLQRSLGELWQLPAKPLDTVSERRILRLLARYASGDGLLPDEALHELNFVLKRIPHAPTAVESPSQMMMLLEALRYIQPGDNIHRVCYRGELHYPPQADAMMDLYLSPKLQSEGGDPYDAIRVNRDGPGYAIDSATTSEVDDAIGVHVDPRTGKEYFVVYVSDATVYCPFDSALEQVTARALTTTTYLPEGVYFMLPKPIIEAATLRDDRPCRTFNIRFSIDEVTGELKDYAVEVGWLRKLRRITYEQVQGLLVGMGATEDEGSTGVTSPSTLRNDLQCPPSWMSGNDAQKLRRIYNVAKLRFSCRTRRARENGDAEVAYNVPDPLVKVEGMREISVSDQIISTKDARLAVAEMMISANEVCSRLAQAHHLPIPFRGTRDRSSDHDVARYFTEPQGARNMGSMDSSLLYFAQTMQESLRSLGSVTRAIYHHLPRYHAGLDTHYYTHSTSPLRRYADMLVHHQFKVLLWKQQMGSRSGSSRVLDQHIPEHSMASLCSMISTKQEHSRILQDNSNRFWILRFVENRIAESEKPIRFICWVGGTRRVVSSPEYSHHLLTSTASFRALSLTGVGSLNSSTDGIPCPSVYHWHLCQQSSPDFSFVSDIYIPELQIVHVIFHRREDVLVGTVVQCEVRRVCPTQNIMELELIGVVQGGDKHRFESHWAGGAVCSLDA